MMTSRRPCDLPAILLLSGVLLSGCGDDNPTGPGEFPDVRGQWAGRYSVTACTILSGTDPFFCQDLFYEGSSRFLDLQLDQNRSRVSGTAWQGQVSGRVEGTVSEFGIVTLEGQIGVGEAATTTIEDWETVLVGDSLVGSWTFLFEENTDLGLGSARIEADLTLFDPDVPNYMSCPVELTLEQTDAAWGSGGGDCQLIEDESYYDVFRGCGNGRSGRDSMSSPNFSSAVHLRSGPAWHCLLRTHGYGGLHFHQPRQRGRRRPRGRRAETWLIVATRPGGVTLGGIRSPRERLEWRSCGLGGSEGYVKRVTALPRTGRAAQSRSGHDGRCRSSSTQRLGTSSSTGLRQRPLSKPHRRAAATPLHLWDWAAERRPPSASPAIQTAHTAIRWSRPGTFNVWAFVV